MPFERVKIVTKSAAGTGVKVCLKASKATSQASMTMFVRADLISAFGWQKGDKIEVLVGTKNDHGLMRFRKNNSVADGAVVEIRNAGRGVTFAFLKLGHLPQFVSRTEASRWCNFEQVEDGYVEVVLPKWADETAPQKASVAPPASTPAPAKLATPGRAVTGSLMGDPPPNRREMIAKIGSIDT